MIQQQATPHIKQVYFGGSRHLAPSAELAQVVAASLAAGYRVRVGCQFGADAQVIAACLRHGPQHFQVFAVATCIQAAPAHVQAAFPAVTLGAGGTSSHIPARYILRSLAGLRGASLAVFFQPGPGSFAVIRHAIAQGIPVFVFAQGIPAPVAGGSWCSASCFGFSCWQLQPAAVQPSFF